MNTPFTGHESFNCGYRTIWGISHLNTSRRKCANNIIFPPYGYRSLKSHQNSDLCWLTFSFVCEPINRCVVPRHVHLMLSRRCILRWLSERDQREYRVIFISIFSQRRKIQIWKWTKNESDELFLFWLRFYIELFGFIECVEACLCILFIFFWKFR